MVNNKDFFFFFFELACVLYMLVTQSVSSTQAEAGFVWRGGMWRGGYNFYERLGDRKEAWLYVVTTVRR